MRKLSLRVSAVPAAVAVLVASASLSAQQPYGTGTAGSGGHVPQLSAIQPRIGDATFQFDLHRAIGSSPAFQFIALSDGSLPIAGTTLLVEPATILTSWSTTTSAGGPGQGSASFPLPIPSDTNLIGIPLYLQAFVIDGGAPQGLAASRGLRFSVAGQPAIFVACSIIGNDPYHVVDPIAGTVVDSGTPAQVDNVAGAAFDRAGRRVFTASSILGSIGVGDASVLPIQWTTLYQSPSNSTYGIEFDDRRQLVWTLTALSSGSAPELVAIDADSASPNYGTVAHNTVGMLTGRAERFDIAPSGQVAAVLTYLPNSITVVDLDPASPTFLQNLHAQLPVPVDQSSPFTLATQVAVTPDERYALVMLQGAGPIPAEIARLDLVTGQWVDHDPTGPGLNISPVSTPSIVLGSAPTSIAIASHGHFAIVGGFGGCGWVGRLDLDPLDPLKVAYTPYAPAAPLSNGWTLALSNDEREVAIPTWPDSGCSGPAAPQLVRIDAVTGALLGIVPIPANTNGSNQNWYTAVYR